VKAFEEFNTFRGEYDGGKRVFWVNDVDKIFYSSYSQPYVVEPSLPENYWYNMTLYDTELYNFNVNYNPDLGTIALWINAPVFSETSFSGKADPIGMLGTGIDLTGFTESLYADIAPEASLYIFDRFGEITISKDLQAVAEKQNITDFLGDTGADIMRHAITIDTAAPQAQSFTSRSDVYHVDYIESVGWFVAVTYPVTMGTLFGNGQTIVFFSMLAVIAAVIILSNRFLAHIAAELERRNTELVEANKRAEAANIEKSNFLAKMSHEIRTPMNAVIGMSELTLREDISDNAREYVQKLKRSAGGLLSIINDILDFSKIESGKLELKNEPFRLSDTLSDVMSIIDIRADRKSLQFTKTIASDIPDVLVGDESSVRQILLNLLTNAVKYTQRGGFSLNIRGEKLRDDKITLIITVSDSGIGIESKNLPHVFGSFNQFDSKRNAGAEGTGLGLAIVKSLCLAMDGDITVSSVYGKGSTFTAAIILKAASEAEIKALINNESAGSAEAAAFSAPYAKVLIVDDLDINLEVAAELLTIADIKADTALSGKEALEKCAGKQYDLILMDHMMPDMDGIETTKAIRAMTDYYKTVPIIALTANALTGVKEMFIANGMNDFISKPIELSDMLATLKKWLEH
jgi:signal transduction histidine kinase/CheY-like chemotaxis protein